MFHQVPDVRAMEETLQREIGNDVVDEDVQSKLLQFTKWVDEIHAVEYEANEEESQRSTGEFRYVDAVSDSANEALGEKEDDFVRVESKEKLESNKRKLT